MIVLAAGVLLSAAAVYNGWPLLYADTIEYATRGGDAWRTLILGAPYPGTNRPVFYGMLLPVGWAPWGTVYLQAVALAYLLWLTTRAVWGRADAPRYLLIVAGLALGTGASWFASFLMPDAFAPVLILGVFLLACAAPQLGAWERCAVALLVVVSVAVHTSHVLLAALLGAVAVAIQWLAGGPLRPALVRTYGPVAGGVALVLVVHLGLYGRPVLSPLTRPPFLLARVVADGPGLRFLEAECGRTPLAVCAFVDGMPPTAERFLWSPDGPMNRASPSEQARMLAEEMTVVTGALRREPGALLLTAVKHWILQLLHFNLENFVPKAYLDDNVAQPYPHDVARYRAGRQYRRALHGQVHARVHYAVVAVSLAVGLLAGWRRRARLPALGLMLAAVVAAGLLANAGVTGVLSAVAARYQARVVWLLPFTVWVLLLTPRSRRPQP